MTILARAWPSMARIASAIWPSSKRCSIAGLTCPASIISRRIARSSRLGFAMKNTALRPLRLQISVIRIACPSGPNIRFRGPPTSTTVPFGASTRRIDSQDRLPALSNNTS